MQVKIIPEVMELVGNVGEVLRVGWMPSLLGVTD
jgi:hypothetical protein